MNISKSVTDVTQSYEPCLVLNQTVVASQFSPKHDLHSGNYHTFLNLYIYNVTSLADVV
jgi:hypothetical protein